MSRLVFGPCDDFLFFDRFLKAPVDDSRKTGRWLEGVVDPSAPTREPDSIIGV
jgi:hypothetical protein